MKTKRFLLAGAIAVATAACSGDLTAPERDARAPGDAPVSTSESTVPVVVVTPVEEPVDDGTGQTGSGCCANR